MAVVHDAFIGEGVLDNETFLDIAFRWLGVGTNVRQVLLTEGHCETVTASPFMNHRIAALKMRGLGYDVGPIRDLTRLPELAPPGAVLIVGNAWGAFAPAELDAVERFVRVGGRLMLVGLQWSWELYRTNPGHNYCRANPASLNLAPAQDEYPMNALARRFGIQYEPGTIE